MSSGEENTERVERSSPLTSEDVRALDANEPGADIIELARLPPGAHPMPFGELHIDEVSHARNLDCRVYAGCLDFAAHVRWRSFHCRRCPRFCAERSEAAGRRDSVHEPPEVAEGAALAPVIRFTARSAP